MQYKLTPREFELLAQERQELMGIEANLITAKNLYDSKKASFDRLALMLFESRGLDPMTHMLDLKNQLITPVPTKETTPENVSGVDISEDIGDEL